MLVTFAAVTSADKPPIGIKSISEAACEDLYPTLPA